MEMTLEAPEKAPLATNRSTINMNNNSPEIDTALKIIKRNGKVVSFDPSKITIAITRAFLAVEGGHAAESARVHEQVQIMTKQILDTFQRRLPEGGTLHIEDIQDQVELTMMRSGEHKVARAYVLYREERRQQRDNNADLASEPGVIRVKHADGSMKKLDKARMEVIIKEACEGLDNVSVDAILKDTLRNLFDGVPAKEVNKALVMSARSLIEKEPNHALAAARLLMDEIRAEGLSFLKVANAATAHEMAKFYPAAFKAYIAKGIELELLDPRLAKFDLEKLGKALNHQNDMNFSYLGLQTLYDRYFLHHKGTRLELPQVFFMRVAMGLSLEEKDKNKSAVEFYEMLSSFDFMSSTPTLFNSGTLRPQLSSCYLTTIADDLSSIYNAMRDNALLSKFAGGLGNDWTPVRGMNAYIKGTNGKSQGVVPFLKVANDTAVAVNQGGKRKGAVCAYLESWHIDIEEFLELRKNSGDDRRRTHDMNTANWVPDLFMKRVMEDKEWTLFTPNETPELHDLFGEEFEKAYVKYEAKAALGKIMSKKVSATAMWRKMLGMLFETGHPWITFKDPCNLRSPQQHCGVVHSSNLCTEITLNTSEDEIAVCNLGSVNLPAHFKDGKLDSKKLRKTVHTAVRMLDNVIDINYYSVPQARKSNLRHRPIGLGIMGFQDALYAQNIPYDTQEAVEFADKSMEEVSYYAIEASSLLAQERGSYETFEGSLWSKGILPIDSINLLQHSRGGKYLEQDTSQTLDWNTLRSKVRTKGMRNSNVMAIAPTATIANITGVSQSIEPTYQNLYVKSNLSGEFTVINPYLVNDLKAQNLWDDVMVNDLKYFNGSVQQIDRIPASIKRLYATAFEIDVSWLIEAASRRQKWIDQGQSLNLYVAKPSGKVLDTIYKLAWIRGLKTTYYLRSLGATNTEKSTVDRANDLNAVKVGADAEPKVCSITDPDCEACQ
ncbi:MAG: ribonucleoside-diphosphate reductase subunit alpha [Gammaproteobacteria bacterium]|nr:ribonucleoside-diphosphate reductase subunit alpha [Gammaproteobacteria bacterium]